MWGSQPRRGGGGLRWLTPVGPCAPPCAGDARLPSFSNARACWSPLVSHGFSTDGGGAYERHLTPEPHGVGKEPTQSIESKPSNLRTRIQRLVRRTMCFSHTTTMHDLVIGVFINRYEFGGTI